ncbi:hypothetical protein AAFF_G00201800 [Aldrovandia affinis]|uniref:Uncharacterized protein n=1 Tax=Aldrovandia affinis TaxID=143900 RepID=A0AAD7SWR3_9TELE|nr:hypothetical protein AAFF_G00201800 [Aldrovandia affinis]
MSGIWLEKAIGFLMKRMKLARLCPTAGPGKLWNMPASLLSRLMGHPPPQSGLQVEGSGERPSPRSLRKQRAASSPAKRCSLSLILQIAQRPASHDPPYPRLFNEQDAHVVSRPLPDPTAAVR